MIILNFSTDMLKDARMLRPFGNWIGRKGKREKAFIRSLGSLTLNLYSKLKKEPP